MRIVDLSFPVRPHFRWKVARDVRAAHDRGDLFESSVMTLPCHAFTHVDAPRHFLRGDRHIVEMPLTQWMGDAAVVDLTHLAENAEVTAADLEKRAGHVRAGDIVLLRTDWPRRVDVADERFWKDAPWTGASACRWLVARQVKTVGYDYPPDHSVRTLIFSPGTKVSPDQCTTHHIFFPAGITVVEYLTNLDAIGVERCRFVALPLKLDGADGSPVRAIALVD